MRPNHYIFRLLMLLSGVFVVNKVEAQFVEFAPLHKIKLKVNPVFETFRIQNANSIPFWDDFSEGLDTTKWTFSGVSYTETIGINAPSIGMLLFDGVDQNGAPYSLMQTEQGNADRVTSKPFNLSVIPAANQSSLFLSFYWQAGGRGELPDENDQLTLQFLNQEGSWITVWRQLGGVALDRNRFTEAKIQVLPDFQHEAFQFRFFTEGRLSGPFDSWLVDYVYFNTGRTAGESSFPDRSLTRRNELRLGDYGAYPLALLERNQNDEWSTVTNEFLNLENRFRAMEYSISARDTTDGNIFTINQNTPFNPVPNTKERRVFSSRTFEEIPIPDRETELEIKTELTTGDRILFTVNAGDTTRFETVDFRSNDAVSSYFPLRDFLAYDNGSADYAAGINQKSGQLAVQYQVPEEVFLKGISINFTNPRQANQAIDVLIWKELGQKPIFRREDLIPVKDANEEFIYYSLDTNIRVSETFYIGFAQFSDDFIFVGLDKTNDFGDRIFYNVVGAWTQNEEVKGSLMIRPHMSLLAPFAESILPDSNLRIYPNPVENYLNLEGVLGTVRIFDTFGREIFLEREVTSKGEIVNFSGQRPGIYVLNVTNMNGIESFRILVK